MTAVKFSLNEPGFTSIATTLKSLKNVKQTKLKYLGFNDITRHVNQI